MLSVLRVLLRPQPGCCGFHEVPMSISEAGLLLPAHLLLLQGQGRGEGGEKKAQPGISPAWSFSMPMLP